MSVFFLYPVYLFGLLAASLPILIHLLNRRRLKRIRFPAVRFVLLSQKRISRSYRLRHWLLLALRTLAVVCLALVLANPVFQTGAGLFAAGSPGSLVMLLDNSLSMSWAGDGKGFEQAKEAARRLITALKDGDRAAIIPTSLSGAGSVRLKSEKDVLLRELEQIEVSDGTANFSVALGKAFELLREPAGQKHVRLITDMGLSGWDQFSISSLKQIDPSIPLTTIRIGGKRQPLNGTIKEIRLGNPTVGVNLPLHLEAIVANFDEVEIRDLLVQLSLGGQNKEQKLVSVPPKGETTVSFQTQLDRAGSHVGQVILKKEGLAGNPRAHFTLEAQDRLRVLVVDGDPQTALVQSETFFLNRALNPAGERDSSIFFPTTMIPEGLATANLESYHVVILCNVARIPEGFMAKVENHLRQGGGLMIFSGDRVQLEDYNVKLAQSSPPLLPAAIRARQLVAEATGEKIEKINLTHPALRVLSDPILQDSVSSARVWGRLRTSVTGAALISLADGEPLLIEQTVAAGRVLFFTTSADRDWSDLPVKTAYLPLIQSLTQYLAGAKSGMLDGGIPVGSAKEILLPPNYVGKSLKITKPDKRELEIFLAPEKERAAARFEKNDRAGIYRLALPSVTGKEPGVPQLYAVNPPFFESRLEAISEKELQAKVKPLKVEVVSFEALEKGGKRIDLAFPLLGLLIVTLLLEGWLAQRF
jgi:hypothetical protein